MFIFWYGLQDIQFYLLNSVKMALIYLKYFYSKWKYKMKISILYFAFICISVKSIFHLIGNIYWYVFCINQFDWQRLQHALCLPSVIIKRKQCINYKIRIIFTISRNKHFKKWSYGYLFICFVFHIILTKQNAMTGKGNTLCLNRCFFSDDT